MWHDMFTRHHLPLPSPHLTFVHCAGGLTGAGARITGAFGDVFAKLTFDEEFIEQRQQTKAKPPKMGWKLGGFAKVCVGV